METLKVKLTPKQVMWAKAETLFGNEFLKENANSPKNKSFRRFMGECGEIAVYSTFCGVLNDESTGERYGDWISPSDRLYEIKTQTTKDRKFELSFDLNRDQYQNLKGANFDGGILCTMDAGSIEEFESNPIITIQFWCTREAIATSVPRGKSNPRHRIEKSVYISDDERVRTDWENL